jgi:inhibitor of KinA
MSTILEFVIDAYSPKMYYNGLDAITIEWSDMAVETAHMLVMRTREHFQAHPFPGLLEMVPAYSSLTIFFSSKDLHITYHALPTFLEAELNAAQHSGPDHTSAEARVLEIPVCYDPSLAPDLNAASASLGLTMDELISLHHVKRYRVFMLGFVPGFPYLGFTDEQIALPRLAQPRSSVPSGSVGIAGRQTGIYPFDIPGGWQIIGRTPMQIFLPTEEDPFYLKPGDEVQFVPISLDEFNKWQQ